MLGAVVGVVNGLAVADAELEEDVAEVEFDRALADVEDGTEFLVGEAALNEVEDALLLAGERDAFHGAGARELGGEASELLQDGGGDPEAAVDDSVDGGEELLFDLTVGDKALDAEQQQAAELFAGLRVIEDDGGGAGEAEAEGAEILAEGGGESGGVENEDGWRLRGGRRACARLPVGQRKGRGGVKDLLGGIDADRAVGGQQPTEVGGGQRVVLDQTNRDFFPGVVACVFHCALLTGSAAAASRTCGRACAYC